jgi:uncharacterized protein
MISDDVRSAVRNCVLCWLATVDEQGAPNVSPKEVFQLQGDRLLIANIASPTSVRNIHHSPKVCVSMIDIFVQRGYKFIGTADLINDTDERWEDLSAPLVELAGPSFPIRDVIVVRVSRVEPIAAPSYRLFPERTEQDQVDAALSTYGVEKRLTQEGVWLRGRG